MQKENYQKKLEQYVENMTGVKRLLLHSCCAPCSSYCLEYLSEFFEITLLYYNPNITETDEYQKRVSEQQRLIQAFNHEKKEKHYPISFVEGAYQPREYLERVKGYENCPEGEDRCRICFEMRLAYAAAYAAENGFDCYTTTLTISPLKNADLLNEIGAKQGEKYGIFFLPSDFKKRNGYKRSIELSHQYNLYRQDYCGCIFSKAQRMREKEQRPQQT